jgi:hypothetical protein
MTVAISHLTFKAPWPVEPRDFVLIGRSRVDPDGTITIWSCSVPHPSVIFITSFPFC